MSETEFVTLGEENLDDLKQIIMLMMELENSGSNFEDLMYTCLMAAGYCASEAGIDADEFMEIVRSIRMTDDGVHGDC
jgi:hypothetical protein